MKVAAVGLFVLIESIGPNFAARAASTDSCSKDCRDYHRACIKAHSQAACKSELDICMKHCRSK